MMGSVKRSRIKIDHTKVIDGFGELAGRHTYEPREVRCGLCGKPFVFSTKAQKYVHEVRGVPYKRADSGAAYCATCLPRRVARNRAVRNEAAIAAAYVRALSAMEAAPDEVEAIFAVLEAAVALHRIRPSPTRADRLIALARRAGRIRPADATWRLWEARVQLLRGRLVAARRTLGIVIETSSGSIRRAAERLLASIPDPSSA